jgi:hypothetical protein
MKTVAIESLRRHLGQMLRSEEPVLVTRYGKLAGVFYPLPDPKTLAARLKTEPAEKRRARRGTDGQLPLIRGE